MNHFYFNENFGEQWFDYKDLYRDLVINCSDLGHIVEIGSWKGRSAAFMAVEIINSTKKIKLDCVDTWSGSLDPKEVASVVQYQNLSNNDDLYNIFLSNVDPVRDIINPIRMPSVEAAGLYEDSSLDSVFIDACHEYQCVCDDIKAWLPKVKIGGILAGHDIHHPPVSKAVKEILHTFDTRDNCWVYTKK